MNMANGHHHSASYDFNWSDTTNSYTIRALALHEMPGCWSLRWTLSEEDNHKNSMQLLKITAYENLSDSENENINAYCAGNDDGSGGHHGEHH